jgi:hypothetical protein
MQTCKNSSIGLFSALKMLNYRAKLRLSLLPPSNKLFTASVAIDFILAFFNIKASNR